MMSKNRTTRILWVIIIFLLLSSSKIIYHGMIDHLNFDDEVECERKNSPSDFELIGFVWEELPIRYYFDDTVNSTMIDHFETGFDIWDELSPHTLFEKTLEDNYDLHVSYTNKTNSVGEVLVSRINDIFFTDNMDLIINSDYDDVFRIGEPVNCDGVIWVDLMAVIVHEIGHVLGLDHNNHVRSTMYPHIIGNYQRTLNVGDIAGFCELYECREGLI